MKTKKCLNCKETKPFSEFYKSKRNANGIRTWCKICDSERAKKHYKKSLGKTHHLVYGERRTKSHTMKRSLKAKAHREYDRDVLEIQDFDSGESMSESDAYDLFSRIY